MPKDKNTGKKSPLDDKYLRRPGQSSDEKIGELQGNSLLWIVVSGFLIAGILMEWMIALVKIPLEPMFLIFPTILVVIFVLFSFWKLSRIKKEIQNYKLGREGEREVAEYLDDLTRKGCYVFHDVPGDKFNIDHIVVSKYGIFTLETKAFSSSGTEDRNASFDGTNIKLGNGKSSSRQVDQAIWQATWLQSLIRKQTQGKTFTVIPIVVLLKWNVPQEQMKHKGIWVLNQKWIVNSITQLQPTRTPDDILLLVNIICPLITINRNST